MITQQNKQEITYALEELTKLFNSWGTTISDWILILHYAEILQGYEIEKTLRAGHFNIFVNYQKLPWQIPDELINIEAIVPQNSTYYENFTEFQIKTGFEFDMIPLKAENFLHWKEKTIEYPLPEGSEVTLLTIQGSLDYINETLLNWRDLSENKIQRITTHLVEISQSAESLGHAEIYQKAQKLSEHYTKEIQIDTQKQYQDTSSELSGLVIHRNKESVATGMALNYDEKSDEDIPDGAILICKKLSKKVMGNLNKLKIIIVEEGGMLSHAAIISREFKIPCIVGVKNVAETIKTGQNIEINFDNGKVKVI